MAEFQEVKVSGHTVRRTKKKVMVRRHKMLTRAGTVVTVERHPMFIKRKTYRAKGYSYERPELTGEGSQNRLIRELEKK